MSDESYIIRIGADISSAQSAINSLATNLKNINKAKITPNLQAPNLQKLQDLGNQIQTLITKGFKSKNDVINFNNLYDSFRNELSKIGNEAATLSGGINLNDLLHIDGLAEAQAKLNSITSTIQQFIQGVQIGDVGGIDFVSQINAQFASLNDIDAASAAGKLVQDFIDQFRNGDVTNTVKEFQQELATSFSSMTFSDPATLTTFNNILALMQQASKDIKDAGLAQQFDAAANAVNKIQSNAINKMVNDLTKSSKAANATADGMTRIEKTAKGAAGNIQKTSNNLSQFAGRLEQMFSISAGFNKLRSVISQAKQAISEIDAAMTETAVVSKETVSSMWDKLPQYTREAQKLGSTITDVVKAQTIYVQQGLSLDTSLDLGRQTIKMARVAGINADQAATAMTSALHGFNMQLTEDSAAHINDVYSKLAQNTASNTQQISTAMTKVASIANSAGMSFENTSAFLAQIIETTQESPETAGTALKTVIARFSEVKKLYNEAQVKGTDEEGEGIDVNKIQTALKTAGIDMTDYFLGSMGLDEVFMQLSEKWNDLSTLQQRYIATTAAGSRQQSRFIALMQDYSRMQQLTGMAGNATGSGEEQFAKTLDSYESKMNELKTAWQEMMMAAANSDLVKTIITGLTQAINLANKFVSTLTGEGISGNKSALTTGLLTLGFLGTGTITKNISAIMRGSSERFGLAARIGDIGIGKRIGQVLFGSGISQTMYQNAAGQRVSATEAMTDGILNTGYTTSSYRQGGILNTYLNNLRFRNPVIDKKYLDASDSALAAQTKAKANLTAAQDAYNNYYNWGHQQGTTNYNNRIADNLNGSNISKKRNQMYASNYEKKLAQMDNNQIAAQAAADKASADLALAKKQEEKAKRNAAVAGTVQLAGAGLLIAGTIASNKAKNLREQGRDEEANKAEARAAGEKTAGLVASTLTPILSQFGIWGTVAAAAISIASGLVAKAKKKIQQDNDANETLTEQAENRKAQSEDAKQMAKKVGQDKENFDDQINIYKAQQDILKKTVKGTKEYNDALSKSNETVASLKQKYTNLALTTNNVTGAMEISTDQLNTLQVDLSKGQVLTDIGSIILTSINDAWLTNFNTSAVLESKNWLGRELPSIQFDITDLTEKDLLKFFNFEQKNNWRDQFVIFENQAYAFGDGEYFDWARVYWELGNNYLRSIEQYKIDLGEFAEKFNSGKLEGYFWAIENRETYDEYVKHAGTDNADEATFSTAQALFEKVLVRFSQEQRAMIYSGQFSQFKDAQRIAYQQAADQMMRAFQTNGTFDKEDSNLLQAYGNMFARSPEIFEGLEKSIDALKISVGRSSYSLSEISKKNVYALQEAYKQVTGTQFVPTSLLQANEKGEYTDLYNAVYSAAYASVVETSIRKEKELFSSINNGQQLLDIASLDINAQIKGITWDGLDEAAQKALQTIGVNKDVFSKYTASIGQAQQALSEVWTKAAGKDSNATASNQKKQQLISLNSKFASKTGGTTIFSVFSNLKNASDEMVDEFTSMWGHINWDDPINAIKELTWYENYGTKQQKEWAKTWKGLTNSTVFSGASIVKSIFGTEEWNDIYESLNETYSKTGKLTASDIKSLAEKFTVLQNVVDSVGISFEGLAQYFQDSIQMGMNWATSMSDNILAMYKDMSSAIENDLNAIDWVKNFEFTADISSVGSFFETAAKDVKAMIDAGQYGNQNLIDYLEYFFGPNALKDNNGDYLKGDELINKIKELSDRLQLWGASDTAGTKAQAREFASTLSNAWKGSPDSNAYFKYNPDTQSFEYSLGDMTPSQFLANFEGIPAELASAMMAVLDQFTTEGGHFSQKYSKDQAYSAIKANGNKNFTTDDAEYLAQKFGLTTDEVITELQSDKYGLNYVKTKDANGYLSAEEILGKEADTDVLSVKGYQELQEKLGNSELTSQIFNDYIRSQRQNGEPVEVQLDNGKTLKVEAGQTYEEALANYYSAQAIADALSSTTNNSAQIQANAAATMNNAASMFMRAALLINKFFTQDNDSTNLKREGYEYGEWKDIGYAWYKDDKYYRMNEGKWQTGVEINGQIKWTDIENPENELPKWMTEGLVVSVTFDLDNPTAPGADNQSGDSSGAFGTAYASGTWSSISGSTLVGELGKEMVVDPHSGQWYTVGNTGAEFTDLPNDAIVFNHKQTENILKYGHINNRGKAMAKGTRDPYQDFTWDMDNKKLTWHYDGQTAVYYYSNGSFYGENYAKVPKDINDLFTDVAVHAETGIDAVTAREQRNPIDATQLIGTTFSTVFGPPVPEASTIGTSSTVEESINEPEVDTSNISDELSDIRTDVETLVDSVTEIENDSNEEAPTTDIPESPTQQDNEEAPTTDIPESPTQQDNEEAPTTDIPESPTQQDNDAYARTENVIKNMVRQGISGAEELYSIFKTESVAGFADNTRWSNMTNAYYGRNGYQLPSGMNYGQFAIQTFNDSSTDDQQQVIINSPETQSNLDTGGISQSDLNAYNRAAALVKMMTMNGVAEASTLQTILGEGPTAGFASDTRWQKMADAYYGRNGFEWLDPNLNYAQNAIATFNKYSLPGQTTIGNIEQLGAYQFWGGNKNFNNTYRSIFEMLGDEFTDTTLTGLRGYIGTEAWQKDSQTYGTSQKAEYNYVLNAMSKELIRRASQEGFYARMSELGYDENSDQYKSIQNDVGDVITWWRGLTIEQRSSSEYLDQLHNRLDAIETEVSGFEEEANEIKQTAGTQIDSLDFSPLIDAGLEAGDSAFDAIYTEFCDLTDWWGSLDNAEQVANFSEFQTRFDALMGHITDTANSVTDVVAQADDEFAKANEFRQSLLDLGFSEDDPIIQEFDRLLTEKREEWDALSAQEKLDKIGDLPEQLSWFGSQYSIIKAQIDGYNATVAALDGPGRLAEIAAVGGTTTDEYINLANLLESWGTLTPSQKYSLGSEYIANIGKELSSTEADESPVESEPVPDVTTSGDADRFAAYAGVSVELPQLLQELIDSASASQSNPTVSSSAIASPFLAILNKNAAKFADSLNTGNKALAGFNESVTTTAKHVNPWDYESPTGGKFKFLGNQPTNGGGGTNRLNAQAFGNAFASGNTLVGELGQEMVVNPHSGSWYIVGNNGAEFTDLPRDAIVFNHKQTESILKYGHINNRGKAMANGTDNQDIGLNIDSVNVNSINANSINTSSISTSETNDEYPANEGNSTLPSQSMLTEQHTPFTVPISEKEDIFSLRENATGSVPTLPREWVDLPALTAAFSNLFGAMEGYKQSQMLGNQEGIAHFTNMGLQYRSLLGGMLRYFSKEEIGQAIENSGYGAEYGISSNGGNITLVLNGQAAIIEGTPQGGGLSDYIALSGLYGGGGGGMSGTENQKVLPDVLPSVFELILSALPKESFIAPSIPESSSDIDLSNVSVAVENAVGQVEVPVTANVESDFKFGANVGVAVTVNGDHVWVNNIPATGEKNGETSTAAGEGGESEATGSSFAKGTKNDLVGELGREIVVDPSSGTWQTVGDAGAEFIDLPKNAIVFNHKQTEDLLGKGNTHARGKWNGKSLAKGNAFDGGSLIDDKKTGEPSGYGNKVDPSNYEFRVKEKWLEKPFDYLYEINQNIQRIEEENAVYAARIENAMKNSDASLASIIDNMAAQLDNLFAEQQYQNELVDGYAYELNRLPIEFSKYTKYFNYDPTTGRVVTLDVASINKLIKSEKNKKKIEILKQLKSRYEEAAGGYNKALEAVEKTISERNKLEDDMLKQAADGLKQVIDWIGDAIQKQIDTEQNINDSINDANDKLLKGINKQLKLIRQQRENEKTEEELGDKARRLAYLRQDSSNANAVEIAQLEKELKDSQEDYTDTLIDQKISELEQQNQDAQEQRKEQIELQKAALDYLKNDDAFEERARYLLNEAAEKGFFGSKLETLMEQAGANTAQNTLQIKQAVQSIKEAVLAFAQEEIYDQSIMKTGSKQQGDSVTFTDANGDTYTGFIDKNNKISVSNAQGQQTQISTASVWQDRDGQYHYLGDLSNKNTPWVKEGTYTNPGVGSSTGSRGRGKGSGGLKEGQEYCDYIKRTSYKYNGPPPGPNATGTVELKGEKWRGIRDKKTKKFISKGWKLYDVVATGTWTSTQSPDDGGWYRSFGALSWVKAKQGGLFDSTGLMQIDGTASAPELVLNAADTKNFLTFNSMLSSILDGKFSNTPSSGDTTYDITINAEIANDYDVDKLAKRIKKIIASDGATRRVNNLNMKRS